MSLGDKSERPWGAMPEPFRCRQLILWAGPSWPCAHSLGVALAPASNGSAEHPGRGADPTDAQLEQLKRLTTDLVIVFVELFGTRAALGAEM